MYVMSACLRKMLLQGAFVAVLFLTGVSNASAMTLSGTLYSDEGVTTITSGKTIAIAVGTTTTSLHSATSNGSGVWTFNLGAAVVVGTSTPILIWVDGDTSTRASLFTKVANSLNDITGLDLYQNRVIVSHEGTSGTSTTISNMSFYDYDNDSDIQYNAATTTNTLTVFSHQELHIKTGKTFAPGGDVTINANASTTSQTDGNFHISSGATYTAGGTTMLGGNFMASSSATFTPGGYETILNASTTGKVVYPLTTSLGNMLFTGLNSSTYSFANSATTSDFYIATNATVTAPTLLTIEGNYVNVGGFEHNNGTVRMASTSSHFMSGNTATSSAFNSLTIDGAGAVSFVDLLQIATDTPASNLYPITIDQTNGVLYTGSGNSGLIFRCVLLTGCDSVGDYTIATDTPASTIFSLTVDSINGTLYAGADGGGIIYRCALSTGCDSAGDFTNATDTPATTILSLTVDSINGTLYAGSDTGGIIYRCALSTGCDSATDFTVASDTPSTFIYTLTVDSVNGTLYAGGSSGAVIYRCALSTGCDSAGDFTTVFTNGDSALYSLAVDNVNGTLYAGTNNSATIYRCALSTLCDASGDFAVAYDTPGSRVSALAVDSVNGMLFSGSDAGIIYRCTLSTNCNASGDFSVATDTPEGVIYTFAMDNTNGTLYAALTGTGVVFKCILCNGTYSSSTANANLTIETGASFTSNREMRMSGNYVNSGTSSPNTSVTTPTLVFSGSSAQSLSGTLTATSSLPYTTFIGSGTKTLSSNASTTGDVVIGSGSTVAIPNALSLGRNLESNGTINNSGTLYFPALGTNATGTLTGAGALGDVYLASTQDLFTVATDTGETAIISTALDRTNQVLYVGTVPSGLILRCALTTGCDSVTDFTIATDTAETNIHGMIVDPVNQVLYAGSGSNGFIYRCALSTGCDSVTDFTLPFATTSVATVRAFTIDTTNQVLYVGTGSGGIILRCVLSTGCDAASEFTQAADTTTSIVYNLAFDAVSGVLYLATGGTGIILRCVVSSGCDTLTEFTTTAIDTAETVMYSAHIDTVNDVLYVGSGNSGRLFRCPLSTSCDALGDLTQVLDSPSQIIRSLTIDTTNNILYAGSQVQGTYIYRCILSTGCDANSDFTTYFDTKENATYNLVFNEADNTVYAAMGDTQGNILRRANGITFNANASTSNLTIGTSTTLVAPPQFLSVAGSYTNNGTYLAGGTTTLSGASSQTLAGTMIATSSFNHVAFSGAGTKAFASNASTSNFRIESGSGAVTAPSSLTIAGSYNNAGTFTANSGTTTFSSSTAQSISGIATGTSAFSTLILTGTSTKTFASNASTTNFVIQNGATAVLPSLFSLTGNFTNNGTTTAGTGTTTLNGTATQTLSGTMTGTSAFNNLHITNTSGLGSTSQSILFLASASTTDTLTMNASTSAQFLANSSSTFQNIKLSGSTGQYVSLRSSTPGTQYGFYVPGTQKTVSYVDVRDNSACPTIILATNGTNVNSGNTACWTFAASYATIVSDAHQLFAYLQATTTMSPVVITEDAEAASITAVNDIRLIIATSTTNMRWDTTDVTPTFAGTASGKVSGTVSYAGDGAILIIDVTSDFAPGDTLGVSDLSYARFETVSPVSSALGVRTSGVGTSTNNSDSKVVAITGTIAIGSHGNGQVDNAFTSRTVSGRELLAFRMTPVGESFEVANLVFPLKGTQGITTSELSSVYLYRDMNGDGAYGVGDVAVGGEGSVAINSQVGTITFSETFQSTTTQDYILIGSITELVPTDAFVLAVGAEDLTSTGITSLIEVTESGGIGNLQHIRGGQGAGGGGGAIGGAPPAGDGVRTGGDEGGGDIDPNDGDTIGNEVGFKAPTVEGGSWTNGTNAYSSDGVYTTANSSVTHGYGSFGYSVPSNNQITGIAVKIEASGSTAAGNISVFLSWDGGSTFTDAQVTNTLGLTDAVFELGGQGDMWGRSWTPTEMNDGNLVVAITSNPSGNTVSVDAIQVKVFHQATGGGGGGGGAVFKQPNRYFANVYSAFGGAWMRGVRSLVGWFEW